MPAKDRKTGEEVTTLKISGMSCANCATAVTRALESTPGVLFARVNLGTETAGVQFDPSVATLSGMAESVKAAGYQVITEKTILKIGGMTCAMCVKTLGKAFTRLPGVVHVQINLGAEKAYITYYSGQLSHSDLVRVVSETGYRYLGREDAGDEKRLFQRQLRKKKFRFLTGFAIGFPLMLGMYLPLSLPSFFPYLLLVLTTPPFLYISLPIFQAAARSLKNRALNMDVMYSMGIGIAFLSSLLGTFQILLTRDDLTHRRRYLNARNTIFVLLGWNVLPIINENDTVVVDEIKFGDNDNLSAMVTNLTESHLLVNLTDINGLYDKDPRTNEDARLIGVVDEVSREIMQHASSIPGFLGTGGMASKIRAAEKVAHGGVPTIIANGLQPGVLGRIFDGAEEGTLFLPRDIPLRSRKHWIAFTKAPKGELVIDEGAQRAILGNGKSLLPSGILDVRGRFSLGDKVVLVDGGGRELAVGMVNYHSGDIRKIMGLRSSEIEPALGFKHDDEVIHRDNLVVTSEMEKEDGVCRLTK